MRRLNAIIIALVMTLLVIGVFHSVEYTLIPNNEPWKAKGFQAERILQDGTHNIAENISGSFHAWYPGGSFNQILKIDLVALTGHLNLVVSSTNSTELFLRTNVSEIKETIPILDATITIRIWTGNFNLTKTGSIIVRCMLAYPILASLAVFPITLILAILHPFRIRKNN